MAHARSLRTRLAWLPLFAVSAVSAGCGGATPSPETPATPAPAAVVEAAPDLSEVAEPADLVGFARWSNPEASVAAVQAWTGLPLSLRDLTKELPTWLASMASTTASVDFVLTLAPGSATSEPSFQGAIAIGLEAPLEEAQKAALASGERLQKLQPGVYRLENKLGELVCSIAASAGSTPSRLVCGEKARDLELLTPYMARTLPRQASAHAGDLQVEVRVAPFEKRYGATLQQGLRMGASVLPAQFHLGQPTFDRALTDAVYALVDEAVALSTDLDALSLGLRFEPEGAKTSFAFKFRGSQSWTVQTLQDSGTRAAAAPPMFWKLPVDSAAASFARGANTKRYSGIRRNLAKLLDGLLAHEGVKPADRQPLLDLLSEDYASDAPTVGANGPFDAATRAKLLGNAGDAKLKALREQLASSGWQLFGIEEPSDKHVALLRRLVSTYAAPGVQKQVKRALESLDLSMAAPQVKVVNAPKGLPPGSLELAITVFPAASTAKAGAGVPFHAFVMPDSGRTWMAVGADRETLVARLKSVQASAPESGTLASRAGLDRFKSGAHSNAGFFTVGGLMHSVSANLSKVLAKEGVDAKALDGLLAGMPSDGGVPMVFESTVSGTGNSSAWSAELAVPKQAIQETTAAVMNVVLGGALNALAGPKN